MFASAVVGSDSDDYDMMTLYLLLAYVPGFTTAQSNTVNSLFTLVRVGRTSLVKPWSSLCHIHYCIVGKTTA